MLKASFYLVHDLARLAEQKLAAKTSSKSCRLFHSSSHEANKPLKVSLPAVFANSGGPGPMLNISLIVFADGGVFCGLLVVSKLYSFEQVTFAHSLPK